MSNQPTAPDDLRGQLPADLDLDDDAWLRRIHEAEAPVILRRLAHLELLEEAGRGGQGVVYRARDARTNEVRAVKILYAGPLATPATRERIRPEVEASRRLDHPAIVPVLEQLRDDGQMILVSEWIDGLPITRWAAGTADGSSRSHREVVRAFVSICDAVHHAHEHGIVHRDIKPTNVLIDGLGEAHLLDLGLARPAAHIDQPAPTVTLFGQFVGTPAYAAPEQLRGGGGDVRSDVYALGVTLYESLCGRSPYASYRSLPELFRAIERTRPLRPSRINPELDRRLDAIVACALEKNPRRRYQSAEKLRDDLARYLAAERIQAPVETMFGAWRRTIMRHKAASGLIVSAVAMLLIYVVSVTLLYIQASTESRRTRQVQEFLSETLIAADPYRSGHETSLLDVLMQADERIEGDEGLDPEVEADIRFTIARAYAGLWMWELAERQVERALQLRRRYSGSDQVVLADCLTLLGRARAFLYEPEAVDNLREALSLRRTLYGEKHRLVAESMTSLAFALSRCRDPVPAQEVKELYQRAQQTFEQVCDGPDPLWARSLYSCASFSALTGEHERADELCRRAAAMFREIAPEEGTFYLVQCLETYAEIRFCMGDLEAAQQLCLEALALQPEQHADGVLADLYLKLSIIAAHAGANEKAVGYFNLALADRLASLASDHRDAPELDLFIARLRRLPADVVNYVEVLDLMVPIDPATAESWLADLEDSSDIAVQLRRISSLRTPWRPQSHREAAGGD